MLEPLYYSDGLREFFVTLDGELLYFPSEEEDLGSAYRDKMLGPIELTSKDEEAIHNLLEGGKI